MSSAVFDDGKAPGALRTIGEVSKALGLKQHVLRYWEKQFPMLRPLQRSGNRRYYRPDDIDLIQTIDRLVNREGYTLRGARQALENGSTGRSAVGETDPAMIGTLAESSGAAEIVPALKAIRSRLATALEERR